MLSASIVIPTFNRSNLALQAAKTIRSFHPDIQIIIVDQQQSADFDHELAKKLRVEIVSLDRVNTSYAKNTGWHKATGDVVFFFDDDVEITKNTIPAQLAAYKNEAVMATCGRVLNDHERVPEDTTVETGRTNFLATKFIQQFWSTRPQEIDFPYGCNMSFRKKALEQVSGFDEIFSKIFEEIDLGQRVKKYGKIMFIPEALIYHHKAKTGGTRTSIRDKMSLIYRTYGIYLAKRVLFPFSLITLLLRTRSAMHEAPFAVKDLYSGYWNFIKRWLTPSSLLAILGVSIIVVLRLWKIPEFFSFNFDEEYQASLAWEQVKNFHPIWIGVSASNVGYYLGPGFTYLNALLFKLSAGNPIILGYFSALFGLVTTASIFYIVSDLFNRRSAMLAGLVYGGSMFLQFFDRRFWNPSPIPFISLWLYYSLVKAEKNQRWYLLTAVLFAASFHVHLSLFLLLPAIAYSLFRNGKKVHWKIWIGMIGIYFIITSPLLVFDITHNFDNVLAPFRYIFLKKGDYTGTTGESLITHITVFVNSIGKIWFVKLNTSLQDEHCLGQHCTISQVNWLLNLVSIIIFVWIGKKWFRNTKYTFLVLMLALYTVGFMVYPGYAAEYYLIGLYALFTIAIGLFLASLPHWITFGTLIIFLSFNAAGIFTSTQETYGLLTRKRLITQTMTVVKDTPYDLETYGQDPRKYHPYGGWRYLFKTYGRTPTTSFADEYFGWIYPDELSDTKPELKVVVTDDLELKNTDGAIAQFEGGVYRVYIFPYDQPISK